MSNISIHNWKQEDYANPNPSNSQLINFWSAAAT